MAVAKASSSSSSSTTTTTTISSSSSSSRWAMLCFGLLAIVIVPVSVLVALYQAEGFDAAPLPDDYTTLSISVPEHYNRALRVTKRIGEGLLPGPEDMAYDVESGFLYTGCADGWIRRVKLEEDTPARTMKVENWIHVGGRPLGVALGSDKRLIVADAYKGLLMVAGDGEVHLLTDGAEGLKFGLTDGVDVASDGTIYFTDASYKYNLEAHMLEVFEGRPHGRLMSFDPTTNRTTVLVRDLYFANGVTLSPGLQDSLIFCESFLRRCKRYHIHGEKRGKVDKFIENLPGFPDNIRYDREGHYWIALAAGRTIVWDVVLKYPFVRKMMAVLQRYVTIPQYMRDGGVLSVSLEGKPLTLYTDPALSLVSGGLKIGRHLYYGSLDKAYISRIDLAELAARAK